MPINLIKRPNSSALALISFKKRVSYKGGHWEVRQCTLAHRTYQLIYRGCVIAENSHSHTYPIRNYAVYFSNALRGPQVNVINQAYKVLGIS